MFVGRGRMYSVYRPLRVEARHAVGQHGSRPRLAVAAGHGVVRRAPGRRHFPLRDALGPGIEHADRVALIFGEPQPAFVIDAAAPRAGVGSRGRVDGRLTGLGVDPDDVAGREVEQVGVVLRVRVDAVGADALAAARILEGAEVLHLVGSEIETVDMAGGGVLDPYLVVARGAFDGDVAELACVAVPFLGGRPHPELLALLVEFRNGALVHHADPGVVVAVDLEIESAFRPSRLDDGDRILRHLAGLRVHLAEEHLAEVGVPDVALAIEHYVVRLDQRIRQVVLRDDRAGRLAREARLGLERECPGLSLAQVDAGEPFRGLPATAAALDVARRFPGEALRLQRRAAGVVAGHALENLHEAVGVVCRLHDALESVAAVAVEENPLLLVRAGLAQHPLGVGQVRGKILHFPELDVGAGHAARRDVRGPGTVDLEAGGARFQAVVPGLEPRGRKGKAPLGVRDDADADRRAVFPRADDDGFHRPFLGGADLAGQSYGRLCVRRRCEKSERNSGQGAANNGIHLSLLSQIRAPAAIVTHLSDRSRYPSHSGSIGSKTTLPEVMP